MDAFGEIIRAKREEKHLPLRKVAAYLDIDQAILSKIERGLRKATKPQVIKLSKFFQVDRKLMLTAWLSDSLVFAIQGEDVAVEAIHLAEEKVLYQRTPTLSVSEIREELSIVFRKDSRVLKAWLFGSFSRGEADHLSDIDIMIRIDQRSSFGLFDLAEIKHLGEEQTGRRIDLVMEGAAKQFAKTNIENNLLLIYEKK